MQRIIALHTRCDFLDFLWCIDWNVKDSFDLKYNRAHKQSHESHKPSHELSWKSCSSPDRSILMHTLETLQRHHWIWSVRNAIIKCKAWLSERNLCVSSDVIILGMQSKARVLFGITGFFIFLMMKVFIYYSGIFHPVLWETYDKIHQRISHIVTSVRRSTYKFLLKLLEDI